METEEVEDILQEFVNKSLLFCDRNGKSFHYYLHDLQLDFLTEKNRNQLQVTCQLILAFNFTLQSWALSENVALLNGTLRSFIA